MMKTDDLRKLIDSGDCCGLRALLKSNPDYANRPVSWYLNQPNESDPLHYVCDSVFNGWLKEECGAEIAALLLNSGAAIEGAGEKESPLIAATSLGVESVAKLLIDTGADIEAMGVFGARPLHWAAAVGLPSTVETLLKNGAELEAKCTEFASTPLFWAVVGAGPNGPNRKREPLLSAKVLINAGARIDTVNKDQTSALERARLDGSVEMESLLIAALDQHDPTSNM